MLGYDDSLDVVAVHLVGGIVGTVMIGFVGVDVGIFDGGGTEQLVKQVIGVGAVFAYSFIATMIIGKIVCTSTTTLKLRAVDQFGATSGNMLNFSGKALINKVGSIG